MHVLVQGRTPLVPPPNRSLRVVPLSLCCSQWQDRSPLNGNRPRPARTGLLLPELAQLQHLSDLLLEVPATEWGLPAEWGQPGAFPSLQR